MQQYNENDFDALSIKCPNCGWTGKGSDAHMVDFFGVTAMMEAHCPNCDEKLAEVKRADNSSGTIGGDQLSNQIF